MDFIAEDAGLINAQSRLGAISEFGARGEEGVVADGLENGELRAMNVCGEKFRAGVGRDGRIHGTGDDLRGENNFCECVRIEGRS